MKRRGLVAIAAAGVSAAATAAESDALSTAFLLMPPEQVEQYCADHPETAALLALLDTDPPRPARYGRWE